MDFITQNKTTIDILQKFIDEDCVLCGSFIINMLVNHTFDNMEIYFPANKQINFLDIFGSIKVFESKILSSTETLWTINNMTFTLLSKLRDNNDLCLSKNGIFIVNHDSIDVLKTFKSIMINNDDCDRAKISISWIKYLISTDNEIYGSWPSRYITNDCNNCDESEEHDIDVHSNNIQQLRQFMAPLNISGFCEIKDVNIKDAAGYHDKNSFNARIKLQGWNLIFDIHKTSNNISCDAFYNNLKMTREYLTINHIPDKLNFLETLILTFNDLFCNQYTLIKSIPKIFKNKADFRLLLKPYLFSLTRIISYDYLEYINAKPMHKLTNIVTNKNCNKHESFADQLTHPVINMSNKKPSWCLNCIYDHVLLQKS